jgi:hypothetical protein
MPSSRCLPWQHDQPGLAGDRKGYAGEPTPSGGTRPFTGEKPRSHAGNSLPYNGQKMLFKARRRMGCRDVDGDSGSYRRHRDFALIGICDEDLHSPVELSRPLSRGVFPAHILPMEVLGHETGASITAALPSCGCEAPPSRNVPLGLGLVRARRQRQQQGLCLKRNSVRAYRSG